VIYIEPGVYVRIQELANKAHPLPLQSGFSNDRAYRALGLHSASETSECYYILVNDRDETWFISYRHLRVVGVFAERRELSFSLSQPQQSHGLSLAASS
jgi:hypothetical protein